MLDLVESGTIRLWDLLVIRKAADGSVVAVEVSDIGHTQPSSSSTPPPQQQYVAAPPPAPPAAPAAGIEQSTIDQLRQLGDLHAQGILTDEEFAAQKAKLLG